MSLHPPILRAAAGGAAALALAAPAAAAAAPRQFTNLAVAARAAAPRTAVYGGHTSQFDPIGFRVAGGGRSLDGLLLHVETTCDNGEGYSWAGGADVARTLPASPEPDHNVFAPRRLTASRALRAEGRVLAGYGDTLGLVTQRIAGRFRGGTARGTLEATIDVSDRATGRHVTTCRSGKLRWSARSAPARVYAGLTSDARPVVVERSRDGGKVKVFWVTYLAPCEGGGSVGRGMGLSNFPIAGGAFGDEWTDGDRAEDGSEEQFAFRLEGNVGRTRARGTFQAKVTEKDPAGATTDTCDSGALAWSARSTRGRAPRVRGEVRRVGRVGG